MPYTLYTFRYNPTVIYTYSYLNIAYGMLKIDNSIQGSSHHVQVNGPGCTGTNLTTSDCVYIGIQIGVGSDARTVHKSRRGAGGREGGQGGVHTVRIDWTLPVT